MATVQILRGTSVTVTETNTCPELMKVVERSEPFQRTVAPLTNLFPATVKVKAVPILFHEEGSRLEMTGTGTDTFTVTVWLAVIEPLKAVSTNWVS